MRRRLHDLGVDLGVTPLNDEAPNRFKLTEDVLKPHTSIPQLDVCVQYVRIATV